MNSKMVKLNIIDCGVLDGSPEVRGLIIDINDLVSLNATELSSNNALQGYRIEYYNDSYQKIRNTFFSLSQESRNRGTLFC